MSVFTVCLFIAWQIQTLTSTLNSRLFLNLLFYHLPPEPPEENPPPNEELLLLVPLQPSEELLPIPDPETKLWGKIGGGE